MPSAFVVALRSLPAASRMRTVAPAMGVSVMRRAMRPVSRAGGGGKLYGKRMRDAMGRVPRVAGWKTRPFAASSAASSKPGPPDLATELFTTAPFASMSRISSTDTFSARAGTLAG
ncbi:MAG: hypothetical protein U0270_15890 [Labilithrix sp.]